MGRFFFLCYRTSSLCFFLKLFKCDRVSCSSHSLVGYVLIIKYLIGLNHDTWNITSKDIINIVFHLTIGPFEPFSEASRRVIIRIGRGTRSFLNERWFKSLCSIVILSIVCTNTSWSPLFHRTFWQNDWFVCDSFDLRSEFLNALFASIDIA